MSDSTETTNLPWYARILVHYQHLTLALLIGVCFGLAVSLIALDSSRDSAAAALTAEHASDIARLGADQSSQPLFNNDLISLQVLLTSLVQLDQVQGLTVHDVENRLLAQAGDVTAAGGIYRTALITQNDNVAGYLTVIAHRPGKTSSRNLWFAVFSLAMGILLLLLLKRQLPYLNISPEDSDEHEQDHEQEIDQPRDTQPHHLSDKCVALTLVSERIHQVAKQLNAATFDRVLDELNRHINSVKTLYGAQLVTAGHSLPILLFDGKDREQNTVNALCSAQLLLALSYRMKTPLALHAQVEEYQRNGKLTDNPERFQTSSKTLFLGVAAPLAEPLEDRFRFREDNGYWLETEEFGESYQSLLDNQLKQLLRTSGYDIDLDDGSHYRQTPPADEAAPQYHDSAEPADSELLPATSITTEHSSNQTGLPHEEEHSSELDKAMDEQWPPESGYLEPDLADKAPEALVDNQDLREPSMTLSPDPSLSFDSDNSNLHYEDLDEINKLDDIEQPHGFTLTKNSQRDAPILHDEWQQPDSDLDNDIEFTPAPDSGLDLTEHTATPDTTEPKQWPKPSLFEQSQAHDNDASEADQTDSETDNTPPAKGEHIKPYKS